MNNRFINWIRVRLPIIVVTIITLVVVGWAAYLRWRIGLPWAEWTGFEPITLWNVLDLIIVPALLAIGAYWLNLQQKGRDTKREDDRRQEAARIEEDRRIETARIEEDRQQEAALQNYLATMSTLLIDNDLKKSKDGNPARDVARSQTLTMLRTLDSTRKGLLVMFLHEAELIEKEPDTIVSLREANLTEANLANANLSEANLRGINLHNAVLNQADLSGADLLGTDLSGANLLGVDLGKTDLGEANLFRADLSYAYLVEADLSDANLRGANLRGANLSKADLSGADLLRANLFKADLSQADLDRADLRGADLRGANLRGPHLSQAWLDKASYNQATIWPDGFDPEEAEAVLEEGTD